MDPVLKARLKAEAQRGLYELFETKRVKFALTAYEIREDDAGEDYYQIDLYDSRLPQVKVHWSNKRSPFKEAVKKAVMQALPNNRT